MNLKTIKIVLFHIVSHCGATLKSGIEKKLIRNVARTNILITFLACTYEKVADPWPKVFWYFLVIAECPGGRHLLQTSEE